MSTAPQAQPSVGTFDDAISTIAQAARNKVRASLDAADHGEDVSLAATAGASSVTFKITTGPDGTGKESISKGTVGVTITASAMVTSPAGTTQYSGSVVVSYDNKKIAFGPLKEDQASPKYKIETSFWDSTKFTFNLTTAPPLPNTQVVVKLSYSV